MVISRLSYEVMLLTSSRRIDGWYQPIGEILIDLNNLERETITVSTARLAPLEPASLLRPMSLPEAFVRKDDVLFILFKDQSVGDHMRTLPRPERLVVYTPAYALRGVFHLGMEQPMYDMMDTTRRVFVPVTEVTLFPLIKTRVAAPREQRLVILNLRAVQLYHAEIATP